MLGGRTGQDSGLCTLQQKPGMFQGPSKLHRVIALPSKHEAALGVTAILQPPLHALIYPLKRKQVPRRRARTCLPKTMVMNFSSTPTSSSSGGT